MLEALSCSQAPWTILGRLPKTILLQRSAMSESSTPLGPSPNEINCSPHLFRELGEMIRTSFLQEQGLNHKELNELLRINLQVNMLARCGNQGADLIGRQRVRGIICGGASVLARYSRSQGLWPASHSIGPRADVSMFRLRSGNMQWQAGAWGAVSARQHLGRSQSRPSP